MNPLLLALLVPPEPMLRRRPHREPRHGPASRFGCSWHPEANRRNKAAKARRRLTKARRKAAARARRITVTHAR